MPPRSEIRRGPQRISRSPSNYENASHDPTLWPEEGSDTDPEYTPSDTESDCDTETEYEDETSDEAESSDSEDSE